MCRAIRSTPCRFARGSGSASTGGSAGIERQDLVRTFVLLHLIIPKMARSAVSLRALRPSKGEDFRKGSYPCRRAGRRKFKSGTVKEVSATGYLWKIEDSRTVVAAGG